MVTIAKNIGEYGSQSSIRPGDDSDKYNGCAKTRILICRNPVFALEMIQTKESFSAFGSEEEMSQSSIRPGDDSDYNAFLKQIINML